MVLICTLKLYPRDQTESTSFGSDHLSEIQEPSFAGMFYIYVAAASAALIIWLSMNKKIWNTIKFYMKYTIYCVYLSIIACLGMPLTLLHPASSKSSWVYAQLIGPVSTILGIRWKMRNCEKMLGQDSAVIISNHQSIYDILGMLIFWNKSSIRCTTIAKDLFFWAWPVGLAMWLSGTLFIARGKDSAKTIKIVNEKAGQVFRDKNKLWIYVEGTRNNHPENLIPFKKGAFRIAIEHQVPIIPVMFSPFYFIDQNEKVFDSGTVIMEVLEPIQTKGLTVNDLDNLIEKTYSIMSTKNDELRKEIKEHYNKK